MRIAVFCLILIVKLNTIAQFGFEQKNDINVIKNNIQLTNPWVGGLDHCQFSNIDLNQDGVQDLFVFDKTSEKIITFIQKGSSGTIDFEYAPEYEKVFNQLNIQDNPWTLFADYNGDGKQDIFTRDFGVAVYKNVSSPGNGLSFELASDTIPSTFNGKYNYIYAAGADIPAIVDVDYDGDLDFLSFDVFGLCVRYYRNLSQETYGHSDSLIYKISSSCFGRFKEHSDNNSVMLDTCCSPQVDNPEFGYNGRHVEIQDRHSGSTILGLDLDADDMTDLILGDVSSQNLISLINGSVKPNNNSEMSSVNTSFPLNTISVDLPIFPAAYSIDINNDKIKDLVISPNSDEGHNFESIWAYLNEGVNNLPEFKFNSNNFLQSDMIDLGSESQPILFDNNGDGLLDLLILIKRRYVNETVSKTELNFYKNTGSFKVPEFTWVSNDFQNLSSNTFVSQNAQPAFADLDSDGDEDMIIKGAEDDSLFLYFRNIASPNSDANFSNFIFLKDIENKKIYNDNFINPVLFDLNKDSLFDLIFGMKNGRLTYYENVGSKFSPKFKLITTNLGQVNVSDGVRNDGQSAPSFVRIDSVIHLIVGSKNGHLHYYNQVDNNIQGVFNKETSFLHKIYLGYHSAPCIADIDEDNRLEMFLGNSRGGVGLFESAIVDDVGIKEFNKSISIYPNPTKNKFIIDIRLLEIKNETINLELYDLDGRLVKQISINELKTEINCQELVRGVYIIRMFNSNLNITQKLIIE